MQAQIQDLASPAPALRPMISRRRDAERWRRPVSFTPPAGTTDTLIISDVHLGLRSSRPAQLLATLRAWRFRRLVLLGDIFHDDGLRRFCSDSWALLAFIRQLASQGTTDVVWLNGNHDRHLAPLVAKLIGIEVRESFRWSMMGQHYLAVHGDRFDRFISKHQILGHWIGCLYAFCQHRLSRDGEWPKRLDRLHNRWTDLSDKVAQGAVAFAADQGADVIVCGHTHAPLERRFAASGLGRPAVTYVNAGSWVDSPASFLTVDAMGVRINHCP